MHKTITFNALEKLSNNSEHIESFSAEIIRKNQKNIILLWIYRPLKGDPTIFTSKIKKLTERNKQKQKPPKSITKTFKKFKKTILSKQTRKMQKQY